MNGKFTPRRNLIIIGLFNEFFVYLSYQKRDHPILESSHTIETFPYKNISLQTSIVGEAQQLLGAGFSMDEWSCFIDSQLDKGMEIFISSYLYINRVILKDFKREKYD